MTGAEAVLVGLLFLIVVATIVAFYESSKNPGDRVTKKSALRQEIAALKAERVLYRKAITEIRHTALKYDRIEPGPMTIIIGTIDGLEDKL